jgi:NDP-sugar pyrophosphorylase family protein
MYRERITVTIRGSLLKQVDNYIDGKTVRNRSHAVEQILVEKFGDTLIRQAVILGGGKGVIADEGTVLTSPLLVAINGKMVIERHIQQLKEAGVEEIFLAVGLFGDAVREVVGDGSKYDIKVLYFERDHGTASILRQAKSLLKETFLVLNGHILFKSTDIEDMIVFHKNNRTLGTISLVAIENPSGYGQVLLRGSYVVSFTEKPEQNLSHLVNAGIYVFESAVCDLVMPETISLEKEIFPELSRNKQLSGYVLDIAWKRINNYENK